MKIKRNDKVKVIAGKDKGKSGKVLKLLPENSKVIVERINIVKKHIKSNKQGGKGQKISVAAPFDISNVALVCPKCEKQTRVEYLVLKNKDKHRTCKKCKEAIENLSEKESAKHR